MPGILQFNCAKLRWEIHEIDTGWDYNLAPGQKFWLFVEGKWKRTRMQLVEGKWLSSNPDAPLQVGMPAAFFPSEISLDTGPDPS